VIANHNIHRVLLDLDGSVNLLSFTVYERLGIRELKLTKTILQLADRSTRVPIGMVEDVLIKVREFIFLVNCVVLYTEVVVGLQNEILIILDQPFLVISNAFINCRDGKTKLTFENMTMRLDVFDLQKQPMRFDDM